MDQIKLFLEKFQNLVPVDRELKDLLKVLVKKQTGHDLPDASINVNKFTVYLKNIPPAFKSELYLHRAAIMSELESTLKNRAPKKIV